MCLTLARVLGHKAKHLLFPRRETDGGQNERNCRKVVIAVEGNKSGQRDRRCWQWGVLMEATEARLKGLMLTEARWSGKASGRRRQKS